MSNKQDVRQGDWLDLEREVADRVRAGLACNSKDREPTVVFLRELEESARKQHGRHQTIQIIASGRRLLGDRSNVGQPNDPYSHCLGRLP